MHVLRHRAAARCHEKFHALGLSVQLLPLRALALRDDRANGAEPLGRLHERRNHGPDTAHTKVQQLWLDLRCLGGRHAEVDLALHSRCELPRLPHDCLRFLLAHAFAADLRADDERPDGTRRRVHSGPRRQVSVQDDVRQHGEPWRGAPASRGGLSHGGGGVPRLAVLDQEDAVLACESRTPRLAVELSAPGQGRARQRSDQVLPEGLGPDSAADERADFANGDLP
mmetsp:Transcript_103455/g.292058  ORF Transcript_103455/g.292058 Transcript_103455/m.292058 type:complete len:226 (-) Transcript_103455:429-1106(-)